MTMTLDDVRSLAGAIRAEIAKAIVGQEDMVDMLLTALLGVLAACGGGGGSAGEGTLRVALTDNPACGYSEVVVTVREVRVHQNDAPDDDAGWQSIPVDPPLTINLLDYTNGALLDLGATQDDGARGGRVVEVRVGFHGLCPF